jgi:hypothetical protein
MTGPRAAMLEIMEAVDLLDADSAAKSKFRELVRAIGAAHGLRWLEREERVEFARELLRRKVSRPTIRDRLMAFFSISRGQAYRIIDAALQLSQNPPESETCPMFNGASDTEGERDGKHE